MTGYDTGHNIQQSGRPAVSRLNVGLFPESETTNKSSVSFDICLSQILEKASSLSYHLEQTSSRMEVFVMLFEVLVQIIDPVSKDSDLHFWGTCIAFFDSVFFDNFLFLFFSKHIYFSFSVIRPGCETAGAACHCGLGTLKNAAKSLQR
jgi:hypothetical protein